MRLQALTVELLGRQERLHADAESLQRALAGQIETMRDLVARIAQVEQEVSRLAGDRGAGASASGDSTGASASSQHSLPRPRACSLSVRSLC